MFSNDFIKNLFDDKLLAKLSEQQKQLDTLTTNMDKAMRKLATHGWYISMKTEVYNLINLVGETKKGNGQEVDRVMKEFYDSEFDTIIKNLLELFPNRKQIFEQAAKAHKSEMYYASVLLFLSQADGLCNGNLFVLKNEKKNLKKEIGKLNNPILEEFLGVIMNENAIDAPQSKEGVYPSKLNRHRALHGLDFSYGTNLNSLKALSLLTFISEMFTKYKRPLN